jgi:hypothetical protein
MVKREICTRVGIGAQSSVAAGVAGVGWQMWVVLSGTEMRFGVVALGRAVGDSG